jgi:isoleucyl-tRNA synthetase
MSKYKEFSGLNLPAIEKEILAKWDETNAFQQSIDLKEGATPFVFYEGPPSANGMPGIHHVISRTLKDLVCRYKTMQGFQVKRKGGWDTHGLPVELGVEKELGITKEDIGKKITVEEYNQKCREAVLRYKNEWDSITQKMGYWVDLDNPYVTFENNYIESLWWILKQFYTKNLLYESVSIQPYSPAAGTGLSSHELNQPGTYKDVKDTSAVAMFKAIQNSKSQFLFDALTPSPEGEGWAEVFFMAWTTTPWTLPSNLGLTVGPNIDYVLVNCESNYGIKNNVIVAKKLLYKLIGHLFEEIRKKTITKNNPSEEEQNKAIEIGNIWNRIQKERIENFQNGDSDAEFNTILKLKQAGLLDIEVFAEFKGSQIENCEYEQLLPYEANSLEAIQLQTPNAKPFRIICGDFVTTEDGTGIVHTAPAFGADDYRVGKKYNIGILTMVDKQGKFVDGLGEFSNRYVKNYKDEKDYQDVNVDICVKLKKENRAFKVEKYEHSYPHCWRTDKPILYYPLDAWFIKTTGLKDRMVELNKTINWKPKSTGEGRFGNWLENMVDWNLSRSRYWGTPLPVWKYSGSGIIQQDGTFVQMGSVCIGNKKELISTDDKLGYYFKYKDNFKKDILNESSKLVKSIVTYNNNLNNEFDKLYHIDLDDIIDKIEAEKEIYPIDFALFSFSMIEDYCVKIDEELLANFDLHKPFIDDVILTSEIHGDVIFYRVPDLVDVWFDSGAMPYAQWHFPFENKEIFANNYPADFIAEGVDQTRGWFYTLHAIGALIKESVIEELEKAGLPTDKVDGRAYKAVVSNGLVLDKNGVKMSKRLGNIVNPFDTIEKYGADATRWYLVTNASPWDNLKFDLAGIQEVQRKFFGTLYNTYQFFALYSNVDGFDFKEDYIPLEKRPEIDRWILSSLNTLIKKVTESMDDFEPTNAGRLVEEFVDEHLSNWYVRLCRRRFWKGEYEHDKISAYQTLYECLETIVRLIAPISPFFADAVFQNLNAVTNRFNATSVHHVSFPTYTASVIDTALEERMQLAQDTCSLVLSLRKKVNIKVRQPLQKVMIPVLNPTMKVQLEKVEDLIKSEVNVKELEYITETEGVIKKKVKANFKTLGAKLGANMKEAAALIANFTQQQITELEQNGTINLQLSTVNYQLSTEDVEISAEDIPGWSVASKGGLTVALDITITPALQSEGDARELINRVQNIRKENGFELTDRIFVQLEQENVPENIQHALTEHKTYICGEILADSIDWVPKLLQESTEIEVNTTLLKIAVTKKG